MFEVHPCIHIPKFFGANMVRLTWYPARTFGLSKNCNRRSQLKYTFPFPYLFLLNPFGTFNPDCRLPFFDGPDVRVGYPICNQKFIIYTCSYLRMDLGRSFSYLGNLIDALSQPHVHSIMFVVYSRVCATTSWTSSSTQLNCEAIVENLEIGSPSKWDRYDIF